MMLLEARLQGERVLRKSPKYPKSEAESTTLK